MHSQNINKQYKIRYQNQIVPKRQQILDEDSKISLKKQKSKKSQISQRPSFGDLYRTQQYKKSTLPDIFKKKSIGQIMIFQEFAQICQRHQLTTIFKALEQCSYVKIRAFTLLIDTKPDSKDQSKMTNKKLCQDSPYKQKTNLPKLHKEFRHMSYKKLQLINRYFQGDYNMCHDFITNYYWEKKNIQMSKQPPVTIENPSELKNDSQDQNYSTDQSFQQQTQASLPDIRYEIDWLFGQITKLQILKQGVNHPKSRQQINHTINLHKDQIKKLSEKARNIQIQRMINTKNLQIDLHGYRQEEVEPLFDCIKTTVIREFRRGCGGIKLQKIKGRKAICITAGTGKGLHSPGNISVLKGIIKDWGKYEALYVEELEDHMKVYLEVTP